MAGPAASVIACLPECLPTWRALMSPYASLWEVHDECGIADTSFFGGSYQGDPLEYPEDAAFAEALRRFTRQEQSHAVVVAAMSNQPQDHQIQCEVVIDLAERLDGWIDFDCLEVPNSAGMHRIDWPSDSPSNWTTLATAEAARHWLRHPLFRMLK